MRKFSPVAAVIFGLLSSAAIAQQPPISTPGDATAVQSTATPAPPAPSTTEPAPPRVGGAPQLGGPLHPASDAGVDKVAADGVSTKTVRAVPCGTAARETDGSTTCVGIPGTPVRERAAEKSGNGSYARETDGATTGLTR